MGLDQARDRAYSSSPLHTQHTRLLNAYALNAYALSARHFAIRAGFRQDSCRAKVARGAMIRCCSDDARPTRRSYMSAADVAAQA
jgi:hypothetical protein